MMLMILHLTCSSSVSLSSDIFTERYSIFDYKSTRTTYTGLNWNRQSPLASYWARDLSWPYKTHGSSQVALSADRNAHFVINNVFQGGIHICARSPQFQDSAANTRERSSARRTTSPAGGRDNP